MTFLYLIILLLICDSVYCLFMKKRSKKRVSAPGGAGGNVTGQCQIETSLKQRTFSVIMSAADSFTFLLFKVVGFLPCHWVRNLFYRYIFWMTIGEKVVIYYGLEARAPWSIKIGNGSIIGDKVILDARHGIEIGENVNVSTGVWIWTLQHDIHSPTFTSEGTGAKITIGNRAWVSSRSTLLPGSDVAEGVVVAAGALLTKKIEEPYTLWGGIPAKKIGERNHNLTYDFDGAHRWFL